MPLSLTKALEGAAQGARQFFGFHSEKPSTPASEPSPFDGHPGNMSDMTQSLIEAENTQDVLTQHHTHYDNARGKLPPTSPWYPSDTKAVFLLRSSPGKRGVGEASSTQKATIMQILPRVGITNYSPIEDPHDQESFVAKADKPMTDARLNHLLGHVGDKTVVLFLRNPDRIARNIDDGLRRCDMVLKKGVHDVVAICGLEHDVISFRQHRELFVAAWKDAKSFSTQNFIRTTDMYKTIQEQGPFYRPSCETPPFLTYLEKKGTESGGEFCGHKYGPMKFEPPQRLQFQQEFRRPVDETIIGEIANILRGDDGNGHLDIHSLHWSTRYLNSVQIKQLNMIGKMSVVDEEMNRVEFNNRVRAPKREKDRNRIFYDLIFCLDLDRVPKGRSKRPSLFVECNPVLCDPKRRRTS